MQRYLLIPWNHHVNIASQMINWHVLTCVPRIVKKHVKKAGQDSITLEMGSIQREIHGAENVMCKMWTDSALGMLATRNQNIKSTTVTKNTKNKPERTQLLTNQMSVLTVGKLITR